MKPADLQAFTALMTGVAEYYGKPMSPELLRIYWDGLIAHDFEDVKGVLNAHLHNPDTGQFLPKIADVVKFLEGNTLTQAMRAWQKVDSAIQSVGTYQTVVFDDPLIHAVVTDMGGWEALGQIKVEDLPFRVREFEKRYQSYRLKPPATYLRALVGISERLNGARYQNPPPVMVGDAGKCALVYRGGAQTHAISMKPMPALPGATEVAA